MAKVNQSIDNGDLTDNQMKIKSSALIDSVLDKLFRIYSESDEFKAKFSTSPEYNGNSLLITVLKEPIQGIDVHEVAFTAYNNAEITRFGARYLDSKISRYSPEKISDFTVQCFMDEDIFIDLLLGKDRYKNDFDINDAFGRGWIKFEGENWLVHKELLASLFTEFRYLLNIKTIVS